MDHQKNQKDPVCGMSIDPKQSSYKTHHKNKEYAFCCQECLTTFKHNPDKYSK
jgi:P-type Cu+ transporter